MNALPAPVEGVLSRVLRTSGLGRLGEMFFDPAAAFRVTANEPPRWIPAFVIGLTLAVVGFQLSHDAVVHVLQLFLNHKFAADPNMENVPASVRDNLLRSAPAFLKVDLAMIPLTFTLYVAVQALALNLVALVMQRRGGFAPYWAAVTAISVLTYGVTALAQGVIVSLRGVAAFAQPSDLFAVIPSAAWAAPGAPANVLFFLSGINPIWLYGMFLMAAAFAAISRVPLRTALPVAVAVGLATQALGALFIPAAN